MKDYFIKIDPYLVERLQVVDLPFDCIDDFTGRKSQSVVVFCDCGGDKKDFEIFGYYVTDFQYGEILIKKLRSIKERHGIPERTIDYKGRKDRKKRIAFPDWINEVKKFPGSMRTLLAFFCGWWRCGIPPS